MPYKTPEEKKEYDKQRYLAKKEEIKARVNKYREENPEKVKSTKRKYREEHKEEIAAKKRADYHANPEPAKRRAKEWRQKNKSKYNAYCKKRLDDDINARLAHRLRTQIGTYIHRHTAVEELGCTIREFREYLAERFIDGMTWQNYGEWHVDHIKPLASFDLTDEDQFKEACHYTNLQPMWAKDNQSKGRKLC